MKDYASLKTAALYEISKLLSSSLNLRANMRGVLRILAEYLDLRRGTIGLREGNEVAIVSAFGMTEEEVKRGTYRLGEGIIGKVAKHGTPIVIPDVGDEPQFLNKTGTRKLKRETIAFLCVPLKFKNDVLGVLSVDRVSAGKGTSFEDDLRILKIVSSLIAYAIKYQRELERERDEFIREKEKLTSQLRGKYRVENIIGHSDRMQEVFEAVHSVAPSKANVMLRGESGTGKELIAKAIHFMSPRASGPFVKFNCASIPEGLLESELFGHEKGSFTGATAMRKGRFELADGGTLFLDEIGDLPSALQPKILRVLQEREFERVGGERTIKVDVRLIAATSRDLEKLVADGRFREDLYYRLNVVPVYLPPLRERTEDIPALVEFFLGRFNKENHKAVGMKSELVELLTRYDWPGNVRELENTIERLVVMARGKVVTTAELPAAMRGQMGRSRTVTGGDALPSAIEDIEKARIREALEKTNWVQAKAARFLGITSRQIGYKMKKYGLQR